MIGLDAVLAVCLLTNGAGLLASALALRGGATRRAGPRALGFALGVLLGAVLLDLLPHLWEATGSWTSVIGLFGAALLLSWGFDRACDCRHAAGDIHRQHATGHPAHRHATPHPARGSALLLAGDLVHSLVDGALIVAALGVGVVPGAVATVAVAVHEVPRRIAVVTLLVRSGWRPAAALGLTLCAGLGTLAGGTLAWWSGQAWRPVLPLALALSAAALLCVALSQSARLAGRWRTQLLTLEFGGPFLAGLLLAGGSHHLRELLA